jgi:hypothetical protein
LIGWSPYRLACKIAEINGKAPPPLPQVPSREGRPQLPAVGPDVPSRRNRPKLSTEEDVPPLPIHSPSTGDNLSIDEMLEQLRVPMKMQNVDTSDPSDTDGHSQNHTARVAPQLLGSVRGQWAKPKDGHQSSGSEQRWDEVDNLLNQLQDGLGSGGNTHSEQLVEPLQEHVEDSNNDDSDDLDDDEYVEIPEEIADTNVLKMIKFGEWDDIFDLVGISRSVFRGLTDEQIEVIADAIGKDPVELKATIDAL